MTTPAKTPLVNWGTVAAVVGVLAVLAGAAVMAVVSDTLTGTQVAGFVAIIAGSTAVAGGLTLAGDGNPSDLIPHLVLVLAVIGLTVALALEHVFTSTEVVLIFGFIIGGGGTGAGVGVTTARLNALAAAAAEPAIVKQLPPDPTERGIAIVEGSTPTPRQVPVVTDGPPDGLPIR
jgi:hypothetical protein